MQLVIALSTLAWAAQSGMVRLREQGAKAQAHDATSNQYPHHRHHSSMSSLRMRIAQQGQDVVDENPMPPHASDGKTPEELQGEVQAMAKRLEKMGAAVGDTPDTVALSREMEHVEDDIATEGNSKVKAEAEGVKASLCIQEGEEAAKARSEKRPARRIRGEREEQVECQSFMRGACSVLDADPPAENALVNRLQCEMFFVNTGGSAGPSPGPAPGPAPYPGPDPNKYSAPAAAQIMNTMEEGELPEQGFDGPAGKFVEHNDFSTMTEDWQQEFGPEAKQRTADDICREFPDNEWCRLHGYLDERPPPPPPPRAAAFRGTVQHVVWPLLLLAFAIN